MKRLCFFMLSLATCAVMMAQKGACGPNVEWTLNGTTLTISGDGEMYDMLETRSYDIYADCIEHVKFEGNVTRIGSYSFDGFSSLKSVTMNDAMLSIGVNAFQNCVFLNDLKLSNNLQSIEEAAFMNCGIKELNVGPSVTSIGFKAFNDCSELRKVVWDASIPADVCFLHDYYSDHYFNGCAISDIIIGPNAKYLPEGLFANSLYEEINAQTGAVVKITTLTTSGNLEYVGTGAFNYRYLKCDDDGTYYIDKCLYHGFHAATPYTVNIKPGTVGITGYAFDNNNGLTEIEFPESIRYIGEYPFMTCGSLTKVTWNVKGDDYLTSIRSLFNSALSELVIGNKVETVPKHVFQGATGLRKVEIPDNVKSIGEYAFYGCEGLTDVKIGKGVRTIEISAFSNCSKLENLQLSEGLDSIKQSAFNSCNISHVDLPNSLIHIETGVFDNNPPMDKVVLPENIEFIGGWAFPYTDLVILNSDCPLYDLYDFSRVSFSGINTLIISDNVKKTYISNNLIPKLVVGKSIEEIHCGSRISDLEYNAINANVGSFTADNVTIGNDVTRLPDNFLYLSETLTSIILPPSLKEIGAWAFTGTRIKEFVIPASVEKIGSFAFCWNPELSKVTVAWENPTKIETAEDAFEDKPADAVLYVPKGTVNFYKETKPWSDFLYITEDGTTIDKAQCATPTIGYEDRRIIFGCETPDVTFNYAIEDEDVRTSTVNYGGNVYLQQSYTITVYASRDGMIDSATETATLYFLQASLDSGSTPVVEAPMVLIVKSLGEEICISGLSEGEDIYVYDIEGRLLASGKSYAGQCSLTIDNPAKILLIHTNGQTLKYRR